MKKWTVMLIPHDRGSTRTLTVSNLHFAVVAGLLIVLAFLAAFFYERHATILAKAQELRQRNRALELENARRPHATASGTDEAALQELETQLRAQYEASIAAITTELSDLYDMEVKARDITGLAPRTNKAKTNTPESVGGKGGPPGVPVGLVYSGLDMRLRPPNVIYGMSRPSADLILQEIRLRTQSFRDLVADMEAEIDRIERVPSVWPLVGGAGRLSSDFGYRRDPFTGRVRHHNGTDISAAKGTRVRATAKGVVAGVFYDRYLGYVVQIDHGNGIETWYCHLSKPQVKEGAAVTRDDVIGTVGATGRTTGPHLHYEVHVKGRPVDPEKYLTE